MGDINQLIFIQKYAGQLNGPFLEVGSKNYGSTQDLRALFADRNKYVGIDIEDGPGVDMVLDLTEDFERIDAKLGGQRFGTIFCLSVLEHCDNPFKMAENMALLLQEKGQICISVPFSWKIHAYPNDYWRFTPKGVRRLFPKLQFDLDQALAATSKDGEFQKIDDDFFRISFSFSKHWKHGHFLRAISAKLLKLLSKFGVLRWLVAYRYLFPPTSILMLGRLKDTGNKIRYSQRNKDGSFN